MTIYIHGKANIDKYARNDDNREIKVTVDTHLEFYKQS